MKIVNLIEDTCRTSAYLEEHGLSFYVETPNHKLVVDTGASDAFLENARRLKIDLSGVDTVILTHGHLSHCGGVKALLELAPKATVYIRETAFGEFYNGANVFDENFLRDNARFIGIEKELASLPQVQLVYGDLVIDEELQLFTNVVERELWPACNLHLHRVIGETSEQDDFSHEQFLVVSAEGKRILFAGCCHGGIVNVMNAFQERFGSAPDLVVGGFHMMQKQYCGFSRENLFLVDEIGRQLKDTPTRYYTCHCTGSIPYHRLKAQMGDKISYVYSGETVPLEG
ncbi:MAG: MBL fold metallo-hydrolase [Oscillospiraceae bacterium]|nr:MBL fold metallo-hydrolase [Oscillospiraceae bacterium]